jgi:hypothetical protein
LSGFVIGGEISYPLGKFVAARQEQPAPLHAQKVLFQLGVSLRGGASRAIFRVP